ncbi:MAG: paraquat-inducible protein A [Gammaproteobacteria bacterium]|nr:paraquat-inducible protein A [Gammaproteobacteria bacterium]MDH3768406.1 paraquat-inducible protein A [Gammaproteobacteria bacterium]
MASAKPSQMVCHECDLLIGVPLLEPGEKAFCPRCNFLLAANRRNAQDKIFAFAVAALLFLALANAFPFLGFSAQGQERTVTLLQCVAILITENFPSLAAIVFALIIAIPAIFLLGVIYFSSSLALSRRLPATEITLRWMLWLLPWSMAEIFLIGILVSFIKIVAMADVALGLSFWSYVFFSVCITVVVMHLDKRELWRGVRALPNE